jgi:hypothetical protein
MAEDLSPVELELEGPALSIVRSALSKHQDWLKRQRSALDGIVPAAAADIDEQLKIIKEDLYPALGVEDKAEQEAKDKTGPGMMELEDPDFSTHKHRHVKQTRELVARLIKEAPSKAAAVMALNRLEDGENARAGGGRANHIEVIADARHPLAQRTKDEKKPGIH